MMKTLSETYSLRVDEDVQCPGFNWRTKKLHSALSNTPKEQFVRDRNLVFARDSMLTAARALKLYGKEIAIPNRFNQSEETEIRHGWTSLGRDSTAHERFPTPEAVQSALEEYISWQQNSARNIPEDDESEEITGQRLAQMDEAVAHPRQPARRLQRHQSSQSAAASKDTSDSDSDLSSGVSDVSWEGYQSSNSD